MRSRSDFLLVKIFGLTITRILVFFADRFLPIRVAKITKQVDINVKGKTFLKATAFLITDPFLKYLLTSLYLFEEN